MSTLKSVYERFVSQPSTDDLHDDATLSYISSGTNVTGAEAIVKFILRARNDVQVAETILASHEGHSSLTVETAADCKFKNGPSWLVPGVQENLLDGMVVKIPLVKMVVFNGGRIRSIRVFWDQATVLKQLEIVGSRGRGWPITDGTAQIELINKTYVPEDEPKPKQAENGTATWNSTYVPVAPTPPVESTSPVITVTVPEAAKRESLQTPSRRTYSISGDIDTPAEVAEQKRLPRIGWQNMRQDFLLSQEGDVPLKDRSPVRLPRVGQAPRREFSFSNLNEVYQSQETTSRKPTQSSHFEFEEPSEEPAPAKPTIGGGMAGALHHDIFDTPDEETPRPTKRQINPRAVHHETIFHDADDTAAGPVKPSIGGGTGGRRPEETIFVEHAEEGDKIHKSPIPRRDRQSHFSFVDETPATPTPKSKNLSPQHFSIEGTPDPNESEYRARALQRKEVNHFRPDTVPHFEFVDNPQEPTASKKENSDGMNKLLKGIGRSWQMGTDSPIVLHQRNALPKKDLKTHFSFGDTSDEEKENGQADHSKTKRMHVPVKSEEKEWWET